GRAASSSALPTASVICVSSVTNAGSPSGCDGPSGGKPRKISLTLRNSVSAPRASPKANPNKQPEARLYEVELIIIFIAPNSRPFTAASYWHPPDSNFTFANHSTKQAFRQSKTCTKRHQAYKFC